jgi:N-acetylmuramoyl-L-alanine amidase
MISCFDVDILARTLYGEARGEYFLQTGGISSLIAVGNVVVNRVKRKKWFGSTIREVCLKPYQFSCWNENDLNYKVVKSVDSKDPVFEICLNVSEKLCQGNWPDLTQNADHYFSTSLKEAPKWAFGRKHTLQIGRHLFFNLEGRV